MGEVEGDGEAVAAGCGESIGAVVDVGVGEDVNVGSTLLSARFAVIVPGPFTFAVVAMSPELSKVMNPVFAVHCENA